MSHLHITLGQIRERSAPKTYARGEDLYSHKAISETTLRGNVIEGVCEASSQYEPYQVQATITNEGIIDSACTCQYDFGGDCKHVVALLLTYLNAPNRFESRVPLDDVLESRDKNELVALIRQMVKRYPDLKNLIDRPVPRKAAGGSTIDTKAYRKELKKALHEEREWGGSGAETAVYSIVEAAEAFAELDDWHSASTIYRMIIEECLANLDYFYEDEQGWYSESISQVLEAIGECLDHLADDETERKPLLQSLVDNYLADIEVGDVGADAPDLILRYVRKTDIPPLRSQIETAREKVSHQRYSDWTVQAYTEFLAELDLLDNVDPEAILLRLRAEEMYSVLASKLLELKRSDEAIAVIREHITVPYERLRELQRLIAAGYRDAAIQLAEEGLKATYHHELAGWLIYTLQQQGDTEGAFRWQFEQMKSQPDIAHYNELKRSAQALNSWSSVRPTVIEQLENSQQYSVLTRVYLSDEDWDKAWEILPKVLESKNLSYSPDYRLEMDVAEATVETHPEKALPVYIRYAQAAIERRNRDSYQEAANYLVVVRDLYDSIDEYEGWEKLIEGIRKQQPRLPALLDELKKAGL